MRPILVCVAAAALFACGGAEVETKPTTTTNAPSGDAREDCTFLRDRVTTAFVRLKSLREEGEDNAARYKSMSDVMSKLARDLDRPFKDSRVGALASDYKEGARSVATSTSEVAALLDKGESANEQLKKPDSAASRFGGQVKRVVDICHTSKAADCKSVIEVLRGMDGKTSASIQANITDLGAVKVTTRELKQPLADVVTSLGQLREALVAAEQIDKDSHAKVAEFERSVGQLRGLNQRGDQLCPQ
jgi:hypothetical protein